jgi:ammonia channel protein AmtB
VQGGLVGEGAALSTMMLSLGSIGVVTLLWSWIGVSDRALSDRFFSMTT